MIIANTKDTVNETGTDERPNSTFDFARQTGFVWISLPFNMDIGFNRYFLMGITSTNSNVLFYIIPQTITNFYKQWRLKGKSYGNCIIITVGLVELRGVGPLSESILTRTSPGAVAYSGKAISPLRRAKQHAHPAGSFIMHGTGKAYRAHVHH